MSEVVKEEKRTKLTFEELYSHVNKFLKKFPLTIAWRIRQHTKVLAKHINLGEELFYIFPAQKNPNPFNFFSTCLVAFTSKRIIIAQKKVVWGYLFMSVTPDMFNDFEVYKGMILGRLDIDTIKEVIRLSDLDPRSLVEIETNLSEYLLKVKPKFVKHKEKEASKD